MAFHIPLEIQATINTAIAGFWSQYGPTLFDKLTGRVVNEAKWRLSVETYYTSLFEHKFSVHQFPELTPSFEKGIIFYVKKR